MPGLGLNVINNHPYIVSGLQVLKEFEKGVGMKQQWKLLEPNGPSILKFAQALNMVQPFSVNMCDISQFWDD